MLLVVKSANSDLPSIVFGTDLPLGGKYAVVKKTWLKLDPL